MPGEVQIDKKYVPVSCFAEALANPERIEILKTQIRQRASRECNSILRSLYADIERYPALEKTIRYCCKETIMVCFQIHKAGIMQAKYICRQDGRIPGTCVLSYHIGWRNDETPSTSGRSFQLGGDTCRATNLTTRDLLHWPLAECRNPHHGRRRIPSISMRRMLCRQERLSLPDGHG